MPISSTHPNYVPPDGRLDARIVIVGEAPGAHEERYRTPFVGPSGNLLWKELLTPRAGIRREDCLLINVCPIRPPMNRLHRLHEVGIDLKDEMAECRRIIGEHPHDLIVACGETALTALTNRKGITKYRGSLLVGAGPGGCDVYPIFHPAYILKAWKELFVTRADMSKLARYWKGFPYDDEVRVLTIYGQTIARSLRTRTVTPNPESFHWWREQLRSILSLLIQDPSLPLCFDIETYAGTITVVGLATSSREAISIPFTGQFSPSEEADLIATLRDILATPNPKITQNGIYDASYLAWVWNLPVRGMVWDTMLMHHAIYAEQSHGLAFLTSIYTDLPFFKMMAKEADDANYHTAHWEYNALDVAATYSCFERLQQELVHFKLLDFYFSYYVPLSRTLARVQSRGISINVDKRAVLRDTYSKELITTRERITEIAGQELNTNSPKQMKDFLYGTLNLPPQLHRQRRTITVDETAIQTLRRRYPPHKEFFDLILDARDKQKVLSTYLKHVEDPDGRVRTSYNIAGSSRRADSKGGTETGRLSSGENIFGRGTNLQNQPKWVRELYIPDSDFIFWQADLSAAESYVVAWDSGDPRMLEILTDHRTYRKDGPDKLLYHENIGSIILNIAPEEIIGPNRDLAKRVGHGWNYGMGPRKLVEIVNNALPNYPFVEANAKTCYQSLDNALGGVIAWRDRIRQQVQSSRTIHNPFGRMRIFMGRLEEATYREAYAFIPQSTVGDTINLSMVELERRFGGRTDVQLFGQVHDSVFGQCRGEVLDEVRAEIEEVLERPLPMECEGLTLRIPCEFTSGANWKECG
jgi:DNA polymerase-1